MTVNKTNVLNNFFSRNTIRHCIDEVLDKNYVSVIKKYIQEPECKKNSEVICEIYNKLKLEYRNEYFYKNTLLNKLLLGIHSINTTTALTELPIGNSKADFVMINGKAVVYEIKTELDNLDRLEKQINDYYKAFNHVSIVTYEKNLSDVEKYLDKIDKPVGIYILNKRGTITTIRKPHSYDDCLDKNVLFKILRKNEYEEIILNQFHKLPVISEFQYYSACKKMFFEIPISESYHEVIRLLKKRTQIDKEEFKKVPYELKFLVYFMNLKKNDYRKLNHFLEETCGGESNVFSIFKR